VRQAIALTITCVLFAANADYESARRKADLIENDQAKPGSMISFNGAEANAFAREEARREVGDGLRNAKIWFSQGKASGSATLDFVKLQTARGRPPGLLLRWMLQGEKEVQVSVKIEARDGKAKIDIDEVYLDGVGVPKAAVDLLVEYYLLPRFPDAKIGEWFDLRHRVERITIAPSGIQWKIKG